MTAKMQGILNIEKTPKESGLLAMGTYGALKLIEVDFVSVHRT
jgi:hypothetical protein